MATQPTPSKTTARKPAAPRARRRAPAPDVAAPAAIEATAAFEAAAQDALARLRTQVDETLRSAQEVADQAARDLPARLAEHVKAAEAASDRVLPQIKAAEAAAEEAPERVATQVTAAEAAVEKAIAGLNARLADSLSSARTAADEAGREVSAQVSEQISAEAAVLALRDQAEAQLRGLQDATRQVSTVQRTALAGAQATGAIMIEGLARARKEVADFVGARIRHDVETQGALLGCRNLEDVREVQSRYFRSAMAQYSEEAARLVKLGTEIAQRAFDRSRT